MSRKLTTLLILLFLPVAVYSQSASKADSLRKSINLTDLDTTTVVSISELADILINLNEVTEAKAWIELGLEMSDIVEYDAGTFNLSLLMAKLYINRSMSDSVLVYAERALNLSQTDDDRILAKNMQANAYSMAGQHVLAIDLYEQVIAILDTHDRYDDINRVRFNKASTYSSLGENIRALEIYYDAFEYSEQHENLYEIAVASNHIGNLFLDLENFEQAEFFLKYSESTSEKIELASNLTRVYLNLGNLYSNTGEYDLAEQYYARSLEMRGKINDDAGKVRIYYSMGLMELQRGNYEEARDHLQRAVVMSQEMGITEGIFYSSEGMGRLMLEINRFDDAVDWFERARNLADASGTGTMKLTSYDRLYETYKKAGNIRQSLYWLEKYNELKDSLTSADRELLTAQYEAKFNLRKSQQENELILARQKQQESQLAFQKLIISASATGITLLLIAGFVLVRTNYKRKHSNNQLQNSNRKLNVLNSTIQDKNKELAELNEIKTKLFAIIAHDLRGPLSSLQSLLYLLREHDLTEVELSEISDSLEMNLHENAAMMDNLLTWAKSQMSGISLHLKKFKFDMCMKSVLDQLRYQSENKNIKFTIDLEKDTEVYADYDTIKLVLRNLCANAIKFSFKNTTISINVVKSDDFHIISVQDNGVGIAKENQYKIFSGENYTSTGTNNEQGSGLGLMLCKEFIERHGGEIWFESDKGKGTTFYFTIPFKPEIDKEKKDKRPLEAESTLTEK